MVLTVVSIIGLGVASFMMVPTASSVSAVAPAGGGHAVLVDPTKMSNKQQSISTTDLSTTAAGKELQEAKKKLIETAKSDGETYFDQLNVPVGDGSMRREKEPEPEVKPEPEVDPVLAARKKLDRFEEKPVAEPEVPASVVALQEAQQRESDRRASVNSFLAEEVTSAKSGRADKAAEMLGLITADRAIVVSAVTVESVVSKSSAGKTSGASSTTNSNTTNRPTSAQTSPFARSQNMRAQLVQGLAAYNLDGGAAVSLGTEALADTESTEEVGGDSEPTTQAVSGPVIGGYSVKPTRVDYPDDKAAFDGSLPSALKINAGKETYLATLTWQLNTDEPGVIRAEVLDSGPLYGAVLLGKPERANECIAANFTHLTLKGRDYPINASAMDIEKETFCLADVVDRHIMERYGKLILGSVLEGIGESVSGKTTTSVAGVGVVESSAPITELDDQLKVGFGKAAEKAGGAFGQDFQRPPTITVSGRKPIGIVFTQSFEL